MDTLKNSNLFIILYLLENENCASIFKDEKDGKMAFEVSEIVGRIEF